MMTPTLDIRHGHVMDQLRLLPDNSVQVIVTSPPYWGLRAYGTKPQVWGGLPHCHHESNPCGLIHKGGPAGKSSPRANRDNTALNAMADFDTGSSCRFCGAWIGELGHEPTPAMFYQHLTEVFRECRRVLRKDGSLWLNMGDCHTGGGNGGNDVRGAIFHGAPTGAKSNSATHRFNQPNRGVGKLAAKQLLGQPWRLAFALQDDGWWLRQGMIWDKPSPMPESARDRPTTSHEYIFLLSKSPRYYYDRLAASEPCTGNAHHRGAGVNPKAKKRVNGWDTGPGLHRTIDHNTPKTDGREERGLKVGPKFGRSPGWRVRQNESFSRAVAALVPNRNWRTVWRFPYRPYKGAHFATFPEEIPRRAILAGSRPGDVILDPFAGSGTSGKVALELGRHAILIELQDSYIELIRRRCSGQMTIPL